MNPTINGTKQTPWEEIWNGKTIVKEVRESYNGIRCQHPTCKTHPLLKNIFWVDGNIPIGQHCIKKGSWTRLESFLPKKQEDSHPKEKLHNGR